MSDLKTSFAGLTLKNPIIISSSGLTNTPEKNRKLAEAGAGAIVLKSLFEEQILMETDRMRDSIAGHPEGGDYLIAAFRQYKVSEYLRLIRESKQVCNIPVIASINCYSDSTWETFAEEIEKAGADAIEINILALQTEEDYKYGSFEQRHINILSNIKERVSIPVIMKLGHNLTNPIALINQLYANGAAGIVLFNRFYQPDIDIDKLAQTSGEVFSNGAELANSLRWIGIASSTVSGVSYAASGGVHSPQDVVKALLAGASAVEVCSIIYKKGAESIKPMINFLSTWMNDKGFERITQFRGKLNIKDIEGVNTFERTQFLRYYGTKE